MSNAYQPPVISLFLDKKYRKYILSVAHQDLLKMVVDALTPYKELTDLLSGEDMVTVSGLCEMLCAIRDQARDVEAEPAEGDVDNDYPLDGNILTSSVIRKTIWTYVSERSVYMYLKALFVQKTTNLSMYPLGNYMVFEVL